MHNVLSKNKIKHWVAYGTLLGGVRQNDIIPYDYDFDFGAFVKDTDKILSLNKYIKKDGYRFKKKYNDFLWRVSIKVEFYYREQWVEYGDIYLYTICSDNYVRRYDPSTQIYFWPRSTFHRYFIDRLDKVMINGIAFPSPSYASFLLRLWYGKQWLTPIKSESQGGKKSKGYDYYGSFDDITLWPVVRFTNEYTDMKEPIKYLFPPIHKKWSSYNDHLIRYLK